MKNTLLFCNGLSGSGKTYFIQNTLPTGLFYNLRSATTRPMRPGESEGKPYFFRDEAYFENARLATHLWVNEQFWTPGTLKWIYGIPEEEVFAHLGKNLIYDVIQPRYTRQLIDWFKKTDWRVITIFAWHIFCRRNRTWKPRANVPICQMTQMFAEQTHATRLIFCRRVSPQTIS